MRDIEEIKRDVWAFVQYMKDHNENFRKQLKYPQTSKCRIETTTRE